MERRIPVADDIVMGQFRLGTCNLHIVDASSGDCSGGNGWGAEAGGDV